MDIDRLNAFIDAAQTLSFSETAQHLHVTQPTISKYIRDLEQSLDANLFVRSRTGLRLTEAGRTILPWARHLVRECGNLKALAKSLGEDVAGEIRIACTTAAGKYILPLLAARFRQYHPNVLISILACTQETAVVRLLEEEADLGVVSIEAGRSGLDCQYFFTDHIILIVPAGHPWALKPYIEPADLLKNPLIMREDTSGTRRALLSELAVHDISIDDLSIILEVGNAEAIVAAVGAGVGISFVSRMSAAYALGFECVVEVPVLGFDLRRKLCIVRRSMTASNRAQDVFWGFIHDSINDDIYRLSEF